MKYKNFPTILIMILITFLVIGANIKHKKVIIDLGPVQEKILLCNSFDTVYFNTKTRCPDWVKWKITVDKITQKNKFSRDNFPFTADTCIPNMYRITTSEYNNSGYDRGHICPAADNTFSKQAMKDCMLMTNICPQTPELNRGSWKILEDKCRDWAIKYDVIYIVAGPIFEDSIKCIGKNKKIQVPDKFFKVIMTKKLGQERALGFIFKNDKNQNDKNIFSRAVSVDSVEKLTGFDFFDWLPDSLENRIEKKSYVEW